MNKKKSYKILKPHKDSYKTVLFGIPRRSAKESFRNGALQRKAQRATCPGGGRDCKRDARGKNGIEGLSDKCDCVENWIERGLQNPGLVWEDTVSNKSKNRKKRGN